MKNIDIVLNEFLIQQGLDDELCAGYEPNEDSYYQASDVDNLPSRVILGGMSNKKADEVFMRYCGELGLKVSVGVEVMSFLHEIGHHMTMDFLDEDELFESEMTKMFLTIDDEDTDEAFMKYFTCPIEYEATMDAVNFCNACPEVALKLDKDIKEALYGITAD